MASLDKHNSASANFPSMRGGDLEGPEPSPLPYWLVNIPRDEWPRECPEYLSTISEKDQKIIGTPDSKWHRLSWFDVQDIVGRNQLQDLERMPSDLRRYLGYKDAITRSHGSVLNFILKERLHWSDLEPISKTPFACETDLKTLFNDWPYGLDPRITHLVVWTKFEFPEDPETGDLTAEGRASIAKWVQENVSRHMPKGHVIWFKNWSSLKSVHAVEHFHIMLFDPPEQFVADLTEGDVPASRKT